MRIAFVELFAAANALLMSTFNVSVRAKAAYGMCGVSLKPQNHSLEMLDYYRVHIQVFSTNDSALYCLTVIAGSGTEYIWSVNAFILNVDDFARRSPIIICDKYV